MKIDLVMVRQQRGRRQEYQNLRFGNGKIMIPMAISSHARLLGHPPVRTATLQWLLLTLTLIAAPHASWVPIWITLLFLAIASWRWFAGQRNWNLPNGWIRAASALL
ncbi:MAG: DUF3488 domain-containing protein, partial [Gammaproteobacteria bacterium]|nr:DUF3488 domain-containing protein [Gammaproteobacteria bacterium]